MTEHTTVLLHEAVDALNIRADGVYVDGTFGRGGHSRLIVSRLGALGRLIVFDKDPQAVAAARAWAQNEPRISVVHDGFATLSTALDGLGVNGIDGILCDLGVSSPQLDDASRGFSFRFDAPLDMRMDTTRGLSAAAWLAEAEEQQIYEVIRDYGEERFARPIARGIVAARQGGNPIDTTGKLAALAARCVRTRERGRHPATRTFQAVRIFINRELDEIQTLLPQAAARLHAGGRLAVIAFHSLEDRIVKRFIREHSVRPPLPKWAALPESELPEMPLKTVGKAVKPAAAETAANARARSAVLRTAERTAAPFPTATKTADK